MATAKSSGSTRLGRDSESKRLGVKLFDGQMAYPGRIIVRQRGTRYIPGRNAKMGSDNTIYATAEGRVAIAQKKVRKFNGAVSLTKIVSVL